MEKATIHKFVSWLSSQINIKLYNHTLNKHNITQQGYKSDYHQKMDVFHPSLQV